MNTDPEVQAYVAALRRAGLLISAHQVAALAEFCSSARSNGYWNNLLEVYPFCGETMAAMQFKLKTISTLPLQMAWTSGDGSSDALCAPRTGMTSNTPSGAGASNLSSGVIPSTHFSADNYSYGLALQQMNAASSYEMGNFSTADLAGISLRVNTTLNFVDANVGTGAFNITYNAGGAVGGFYHVNRSSSTSQILYKNGVNVASSSVATVARPVNLFTVFGRNFDGAAQLPSNRQHFAFCGTSFTPAQAALFGADVAVLLRSLRRTTL